MSSSEDYSEEDEDYMPEDHLQSDDEADDGESNNDNHVKSHEENGEMEKDNTNIEELWQSFKNNVAQKSKDPVNVDKEKDNKQEACKAAETKTEEQNNSDTVTITKIYDFAGEEVKVTKEVKKDSAEAMRHFKQLSPSQQPKGILGRAAIGKGIAKRSGGGIGSVLGKLGKKPKLSTLEKSKLDWKQYKEEEGIEDELQAHNKGKEGYLEKVSFLKRTEIRQFEKERDIRLKQSARR